MLEVRDLSVWYPVRSGIWGRVSRHVQALRHVDFEIGAGEIVAIVGESGCGKSTLAGALVGLRKWHSGEFYWEGRRLNLQSAKEWRSLRSQIQMVFQDPYGSLNPRQTLSDILMAPQRNRGVAASEARKRAVESLELVGLAESDLEKYPHAFSGGQRQRIGIARALALQCKLLVCDEPTSALDVSVQAQILQLLQDLRERLGISILLISHDLAVVRALADRVLVMYLGSLVESLPIQSLQSGALHPYTQALLASVPSLDPETPPRVLAGEIPSLGNLPTGCVFCGRCPVSRPECERTEPVLQEFAPKHFARCPWGKQIA